MPPKLVREYQRAQCIALRKAGMSYRAIAANVGVSRAPVQRTLKRYDETSDFQDHPRSGRPKKLNDRNIRMLKHLVQDEDNRSSPRELMIQLNESLEKSVGRRFYLVMNQLFMLLNVKVKQKYGEQKMKNG